MYGERARDSRCIAAVLADAGHGEQRPLESHEMGDQRDGLTARAFIPSSAPPPAVDSTRLLAPRVPEASPFWSRKRRMRRCRRFILGRNPPPPGPPVVRAEVLPNAPAEDRRDPVSGLPGGTRLRVPDRREARQYVRARDPAGKSRQVAGTALHSLATVRHIPLGTSAFTHAVCTSVMNGTPMGKMPP